MSTFASAYFLLKVLQLSSYIDFLIFYVLLVAIFFDTFYVLILQHDLCNTLYLLLMQIFKRSSFFLSSVFHCSSPLFIDFFHYVQNKAHFLFFVYHSPCTTLLRAFLTLLAFVEFKIQIQEILIFLF
jgi:hypothetical protein